MKISMIAAIGANGEIGADNKLLWSIPEDMQWFKSHTMYKDVIMGRRTFESIGKPLPKRRNIVLTRDREWEAPEGVHVYHSVEEVLADREGPPGLEVMVIGGAEIYKQFLPYATKLYITNVHKEFPEADTFFPDTGKEWRSYFHRKGLEVDRVKVDYSFNVYKRIEKED